MTNNDLKKIREYIKTVCKPAGVSEDVCNRCYTIVYELHKKNLSAPDMSPGEDGQVLLTWDSPNKGPHFEIEIFPPGFSEEFLNGHNEAFWLSSVTPEGKGKEWDYYDELPEEAEEILFKNFKGV